ncbi:HIT family protein [Gammaproteobacteria bacterium]|jgi:histidine triad (HIT) family protein|nr:HIT family protein [Gammaproteobacteria bacterium]
MTSIFTKILNKEIPGHFVWEDELCFSIMTIQPIREGHLMVIPKMEVNHWDDVPPETAAHLMVVAQKIAKAIKGVIPCKRIGVSVIGLEVPHTHIHLIPIDNMGDLDFSLAKEISQNRLAATAKAIKKSLQARGYSEAEV